MALFVMFTLLYRHACTRRELLNLTPLEVFDVKMFAGKHHIVSASVGMITVLVAALAPVRFAPIAPMCFALISPAHWAFGRYTLRRRMRWRKPTPSSRPGTRWSEPRRSVDAAAAD